MQDYIIVRNSGECRKCGDVITSHHRHDFKFCKCEAIAVDGGKDYFKRCGSLADMIDRSIVMSGGLIVTDTEQVSEDYEM